MKKKIIIIIRMGILWANIEDINDDNECVGLIPANVVEIYEYVDTFDPETCEPLDYIAYPMGIDVNDNKIVADIQSKLSLSSVNIVECYNVFYDEDDMEINGTIQSNQTEIIT